MHKLLPLLLLSACGSIGLARMSEDIIEPDTANLPSCVIVEPASVSLSPSAPEARVVLSIDLEDCIEPFATVESVTLDDPSEAFSIDGDLTGELNNAQTRELTVTLVATEPGIYEAQIEITSITFDVDLRRVQLFAEVP